MLSSYKYGFIQILGWWLDGLWRHICITVGMTYFLPVESGPPEFWYEWFSWWDWKWNLSPSGKVNKTITRNWLWSCHRFWELWTEDLAQNAVYLAEDAVRVFTGWALHGFVRFQDWIEAIRSRVGTWVPPFAGDLAQGLYRLWLWLPADIRDNVVTWYDKFSAWYNSVVSWVQVTYDDAKAWAYGAYAWVLDTGEALKTWYNNAHWWLDDFRQNAYDRVTGWLGSTWNRAVTFFTAAGQFWYNLWGSYAPEIGAFWADPLGWLYDRVEDELVRRW